MIKSVHVITENRNRNRYNYEVGKNGVTRIEIHITSDKYNIYCEKTDKKDEDYLAIGVPVSQCIAFYKEPSD